MLDKLSVAVLIRLSIDIHNECLLRINKDGDRSILY